MEFLDLTRKKATSTAELKDLAAVKQYPADPVIEWLALTSIRVNAPVTRMLVTETGTSITLLGGYHFELDSVTGKLEFVRSASGHLPRKLKRAFNVR
jgi:hypothetical protein